MMPSRLGEIGEQQRADHYHLPADAVCYHWGEYTPYEHTNGKLWNYSPTNRLIANFKKSPDRRGTSEWQYKEQAIERVATAFSRLVNWHNATKASGTAIVPIPPSKSRGHPLFDDRMMRMLARVEQLTRLPLDVRDCLSFSGANAASHQESNRPTPDALYNDLQIDDATGGLAEPPTRILVFDDVLTSAAHFVATSRKLNDAFPQAKIIGFFIARRVLPNPFEDFDALG